MIGTVARQLVAMGVDVHIVTGDRDLLQLVNEHVTVELPPPTNARGRSTGDSKIYNPAAVLEPAREGGVTVSLAL